MIFKEVDGAFDAFDTKEVYSLLEIGARFRKGRVLVSSSREKQLVLQRGDVLFTVLQKMMRSWQLSL